MNKPLIIIGLIVLAFCLFGLYLIKKGIKQRNTTQFQIEEVKGQWDK